MTPRKRTAAKIHKETNDMMNIAKLKICFVLIFSWTYLRQRIERSHNTISLEFNSKHLLCVNKSIYLFIELARIFMAKLSGQVVVW